MKKELTTAVDGYRLATEQEIERAYFYNGKKNVGYGLRQLFGVIKRIDGVGWFVCDQTHPRDPR